MDKDIKAIESEETVKDEEQLINRRDFLVGLKKWSKIVIGGALFGGAVLSSRGNAQAAGTGWVNGGRSWVNRYGGGGWANRYGGGGAWANRGGGGWANRYGGGGAWANRGGAWANRGGGWVNRW